MARKYAMQQSKRICIHDYNYSKWETKFIITKFSIQKMHFVCVFCLPFAWAECIRKEKRQPLPISIYIIMEHEFHGVKFLPFLCISRHFVWCDEKFAGKEDGDDINGRSFSEYLFTAQQQSSATLLHMYMWRTAKPSCARWKSRRLMFRYWAANKHLL